MNIEKIQAFTLENAIDIFKNNVDAIIAVNIDEDCYQRVMRQIEYMKKIDAPLNLPADALYHILKRYKEEILDIRDKKVI